MKEFIMMILMTLLVLGGYSCNSSIDRTNERLGIEDSESELDPMEREIFEEEKQYERQADLERKWRESEDDIFEEDLGD